MGQRKQNSQNRSHRTGLQGQDYQDRVAEQLWGLGIVFQCVAAKGRESMHSRFVSVALCAFTFFVLVFPLRSFLALLTRAKECKKTADGRLWMFL
jgi:hypothetical protein